jgi:hypothetical protein
LILKLLLELKEREEEKVELQNIERGFVLEVFFWNKKSLLVVRKHFVKHLCIQY